MQLLCNRKHARFSIASLVSGIFARAANTGTEIFIAPVYRNRAANNIRIICGTMRRDREIDENNQSAAQFGFDIRVLKAFTRGLSASR